MMTDSRIANVVSCWLIAWALGGCALERWSKDYSNARIDEAIARFHTEAAKVKPGDSEDAVLALLQPTQFELQGNEIKGAAAIPNLTDSDKVQIITIHFFRSARHQDEALKPDGTPPDDDFTPYVFTDGVLTGIGWDYMRTLRVRRPPHEGSLKKDFPCKQLAPLVNCF
jgi:hypothetical protein